MFSTARRREAVTVKVDKMGRMAGDELAIVAGGEATMLGGEKDRDS